MKNNFWDSLSHVLYFFGFLTLALEMVVFSQKDVVIDGPYWAPGMGVIWLLFLVAITCFVLGANLKHFPVPEKYRK